MQKVMKLILDKSDIIKVIAEKYGVNEETVTIKVNTDFYHGDTSISAEIEQDF